MGRNLPHVTMMSWMGITSGVFLRMTVPKLASGAAQKATVREEAAPPMMSFSLPWSSWTRIASMQIVAKRHVATAAGRDTESVRLTLIQSAVVQAKLMATLIE